MLAHIDDLGACHSANRASAEALEVGMTASGSLMMPCPWIPEMARLFRQNPRLDLGVHATLTSERDDFKWRPLSGAAQVPSLVDSQGYFYLTWEEIAENARRGNRRMRLLRPPGRTRTDGVGCAGLAGLNG